jgi:hypothetical protein
LLTHNPHFSKHVRFHPCHIKITEDAVATHAQRLNLDLKTASKPTFTIQEVNLTTLSPPQGTEIMLLPAPDRSLKVYITDEDRRYLAFLLRLRHEDS